MELLDRQAIKPQARLELIASGVPCQTSATHTAKTAWCQKGDKTCVLSRSFYDSSASLACGAEA